MHQKCIKNAPKNGACFKGERGTFQNASEMRQNYVKNASKNARKHLLDDADGKGFLCFGFLTNVGPEVLQSGFGCESFAAMF